MQIWDGSGLVHVWRGKMAFCKIRLSFLGDFGKDKKVEARIGSSNTASSRVMTSQQGRVVHYVSDLDLLKNSGGGDPELRFPTLVAVSGYSGPLPGTYTNCIAYPSLDSLFQHKTDG